MTHKTLEHVKSREGKGTYFEGLGLVVGPVLVIGGSVFLWKFWSLVFDRLFPPASKEK